MADIDVEKVLSELTLGEKVSITAGQFLQLWHFGMAGRPTKIERGPERTPFMPAVPNKPGIFHQL